MSIEQVMVVIGILATGAGSVWALIKVIVPKITESKIRQEEAVTQAHLEAELAAAKRMNQAQDKMMDQNSLFFEFLTDMIPAMMEKQTEKLDELYRTTIAMETKMTLLIYEIVSRTKNGEAIEKLKESIQEKESS